MKKTVKIIFKVIFAIIILLYFGVVLKIVLEKNGIRTNASGILLTPFSMVFKYLNGEKSLKSLLINYIGNIGLFLPLGLLLPAIFKKPNFLKVFLTGFVLIISLELLQYVSSSGFLDIDDIILNTLGLIIGEVIYLYIFGGKNNTVLSYVLAFALIGVFFAVSFFGVRNIRPEFLPESVVFYNGKIAGNALDAYDYTVEAYNMSHGDVFINKGRVKNINGDLIDNPPKTYTFSDTAVFATCNIKNGEKTYSLLNVDEMIEEYEKDKNAEIKVWLNDAGTVKMLLIEK